MTMPNDTNVSCEQFADTLADFLERDVTEPARAAMEAHALTCGDCGALLADLRKLRIDAANLPELVPSRDLWAGVAERIETPVVSIGRLGDSATRPTAHWMKIGLAAAALVVVTATITHELTKQSLAKAPPSVAATPAVVKAQPTTLATLSTPSTVDSSTRRSVDPSIRRSVASPARLASNKLSPEQTYASEIDKLHALLKTRRGQLDSSTVAVIDKNLRIIDDAITQCRKALKQDPNSRFLMQSLDDALDSKVQLLRTAVALPTRM